MRKEEIKRRQDRRNSAIAFTIISIVVLMVGVVAISQAVAPQPVSTQVAGSSTILDGKTLLEQRCNNCHSSDYVIGLQGTVDQWARLVSDMVQRGTDLNTQEQNVLADYLAQTYHP